MNPITESIKSSAPTRIGIESHPTLEPLERVKRKTIIIDVDNPAPTQSNEPFFSSFTLNLDGSKNIIAPARAIAHKGTFIQKTHSHPA